MAVGVSVSGPRERQTTADIRLEAAMKIHALAVSHVVNVRYTATAVADPSNPFK